MMFDSDGKPVCKLTWDYFIEYQRWDEFPECSDNPPMTTDFAFWYDNKKYYCTGEDYGYIIVDENWNRLAYNKNLLLLLEDGIFNGKSFRELIEDILLIE